MKATLNKEIVLNNQVVSLWYYPDLHIIHHKTHQFIYGDQYRELLSKGAEIFENNNCTGWLSDDRLGSAVRKEDLDWATENWTPRILKAGTWKSWATLLPDKSVGKMKMKKIVEHYKTLGVQVEIFDDENEALDWLKSKMS